jgi:hypothetical protein
VDPALIAAAVESVSETLRAGLEIVGGVIRSQQQRKSMLQAWMIQTLPDGNSKYLEWRPVKDNTNLIVLVILAAIIFVLIVAIANKRNKQNVQK